MLSGSDKTGDSFIVSHYGLDGLREHFMPGNRRRGTGIRTKRSFEGRPEAQAFLDRRGWKDNVIYRCSVCGAWHTASPKRK